MRFVLACREEGESQAKRGGGAPGAPAGFSPLRSAQSAAGRQWSAFWEQGGLGSVAFERVVVAPGHCRRIYPAGASPDNGAHEQMHRILKADTAAPPARSLRAQKRRIGAWIGSYNTERPHEALGQQVPARLYRPSPRRMPRRLAQAKYPWAWKVRRVRNRGHIKWEGRQRFIGRAFVGELVGLKSLADGGHEVYLERHLIGFALRARSGGNATRFQSTPSLKLRACPPLRRRSIGRQLRSGSLRPPALRRQPIERTNKRQKCNPCHENKVLPMS